MKINFSDEWRLTAADREGDCEVGFGLPMGKCNVCGAPIFTSNEPIRDQPCLDCIFDGKA